MFTSTLTLMLAVCDLSGSFAEKTGWEKPAETFVAEHQADGFRFADAKKNIANCLRRGGCTWEGLEVWEARVYYREGAAVRVEMSLYNRGDDRSGTPKTAADLKTLLDQIAERAEPGGKIGSNPEKKKLPSGGYQFQRRFTKGANDVELVWGVDSVKAKDLSADYVRVTLTPKGTGPKVSRRTTRATCGSTTCRWSTRARRATAPRRSPNASCATTATTSTSTRSPRWRARPRAAARASRR